MFHAQNTHCAQALSILTTVFGEGRKSRNKLNVLGRNNEDKLQFQLQV